MSEMAQGYVDPEKWKVYISPEHENVPLHALRRSTIKRLALHLDIEQIIHDDIVPDFGGLAELANFDGLEIQEMERAQCPTKHLLQEWMNRPDLQPTMGRLIQFLVILHRQDVLIDCSDRIKADIQAYVDKPKKFEKMSAPIQDETVSQGPGIDEIPRFVTRQDVEEGQEVMYDAFVCYNPMGESSKDLEFVRQLIARFENSPYNFKLFVPWRDDLAGLNAHSISAMIISQRCRHMIVVLSKNFLRSPSCDFQSTYAHALSPGARNKRLVPIKIEECPIPAILRIMACCDFTKKDLWDWSWERLAKSIKIQLSSIDFEVENPNALMNGLIQQPNGFFLRASSPSFSSSSGFQSASSSVSTPITNCSASPVRSNTSKTAPITYTDGTITYDEPFQDSKLESSMEIEEGSSSHYAVSQPAQTMPIPKQTKRSQFKNLTERFTIGEKKRKEKEKGSPKPL